MYVLALLPKYIFLFVFFFKKNERSFCTKSFSNVFDKNNGLFEIQFFEFLMKR